jgi:hypothetical protein
VETRGDTVFRLHTAPVSFPELSRFAHVVADHLDHDDDIDDASLVLAVDDHPRGVLIIVASDHHPAATVQAMTDEMFATPRRMAAMASRIGWSPSDDEPTSPAWLIVAVAAEQGAFAVVRRIAEDAGWTRVLPTALPWVGLSTAGSLREALSGMALTLKKATDTRLFRRPDEEPAPPVDDQGRL